MPLARQASVYGRVGVAKLLAPLRLRASQVTRHAHTLRTRIMRSWRFLFSQTLGIYQGQGVTELGTVLDTQYV